MSKVSRKGSTDPALGTKSEQVKLEVEAAKQRLRLAKEQLKRARKLHKEAKRIARRARKKAAAIRKELKRSSKIIRIKAKTRAKNQPKKRHRKAVPEKLKAAAKAASVAPIKNSGQLRTLIRRKPTRVKTKTNKRNPVPTVETPSIELTPIAVSTPPTTATPEKESDV